MSDKRVRFTSMLCRWEKDWLLVRHLSWCGRKYSADYLWKAEQCGKMGHTLNAGGRYRVYSELSGGVVAVFVEDKETGLRKHNYVSKVYPYRGLNHCHRWLWEICSQQGYWFYLDD